MIKSTLSKQKSEINLSPSENYSPCSVYQCLRNPAQNKYSMGLSTINNNYNGGNQIINKIEQLCKKRSMKLFNLDPSVWDVSFHSSSQSIVNISLFKALLNPGDSALAMTSDTNNMFNDNFEDIPVSLTQKIYNWSHYSQNEEGFTNYSEMQQVRKNNSKIANESKPKLIIGGYNSNSRFLDYKIFRETADQTNSYLISDISHISGIVAAKLSHQNPFDYCDVIMVSLNQTLRGPKSGMTFYKKSIPKDPLLGLKINEIFNFIDPEELNQNIISAIATSLKQANSEEFIEYQKQMLRNSSMMSELLKSKGYSIETNGTDNHIVILDLQKSHINFFNLEYLLNSLGILIDGNFTKNQQNDKLKIKLGTPVMTTRGCLETDFKEIVEYLHQGIQITNDINQMEKNYFDFIHKVQEELKNNDSQLMQLKLKVVEFADNLKYNFNFNEMLI